MDPELFASMEQAGQQFSADGSNLGAALANYFSKNPYDSAQPWYAKVPGMLQGEYGPWQQRGNYAGNMLQGQYNQMLDNPGGMVNKIGSSFHQSPGYSWQLSQALNSMNNAAAAGGQAGTPQEQYQMGQAATGMANQDYYNYLNHALNMYGQGISGMQGQQQIGYDASNQLAQALAQNYYNQGNLAANETQYGNNQTAGLASAVGSFL